MAAARHNAETVDDNLKKVIERSKQKAAAIIDSTAHIRNAFAVGRPNSSTESTAEGTLEAFNELMKRLPDPQP